MRLPLFLLGFAAVLATAARGDDDCRCWTPSAEDIAEVEAKIAGRPLPLGSLDHRFHESCHNGGIHLGFSNSYIGRV
jgi:hypothetical protein